MGKMLIYYKIFNALILLTTADLIVNENEDQIIGSNPQYTVEVEFLEEEPIETAYFEITGISFVPSQIYDKTQETALKRTKRITRERDEISADAFFRRMKINDDLEDYASKLPDQKSEFVLQEEVQSNSEVSGSNSKKGSAKAKSMHNVTKTRKNVSGRTTLLKSSEKSKEERKDANTDDETVPITIVKTSAALPMMKGPAKSYLLRRDKMQERLIESSSEKRVLESRENDKHSEENEEDSGEGVDDDVNKDEDDNVKRNDRKVDDEGDDDEDDIVIESSYDENDEGQKGKDKMDDDKKGKDKSNGDKKDEDKIEGMKHDEGDNEEDDEEYDGNGDGEVDDDDDDESNEETTEDGMNVTESIFRPQQVNDNDEELSLIKSRSGIEKHKRIESDIQNIEEKDKLLNFYHSLQTNWSQPKSVQTTSAPDLTLHTTSSINKENTLPTNVITPDNAVRAVKKTSMDKTMTAVSNESFTTNFPNEESTGITIIDKNRQPTLEKDPGSLVTVKVESAGTTVATNVSKHVHNETEVEVRRSMAELGEVALREGAKSHMARSSAVAVSSHNILGNSLAFIKSLIPFFNRNSRKVEDPVNIEMEIVALEEEPPIEEDVFPDFAIQRDPFESVVRRKRQLTFHQQPKADKKVKRDTANMEQEPKDDMEDTPGNRPEFNVRFGKMPVRRPNSDPSLKHRHGRPGKAPIVDPLMMFLTVSLPTILCCALLMIFCIFCLNPRGAICTAMFASVQPKKKKDYHQVRA